MKLIYVTALCMLGQALCRPDTSEIRCTDLSARACVLSKTCLSCHRGEAFICVDKTSEALQQQSRSPLRALLKNLAGVPHALISAFQSLSTKMPVLNSCLLACKSGSLPWGSHHRR